MNFHVLFSMNSVPLQVPMFVLEWDRELNQLRSLDIWDGISVATQPDESTGRRGVRLSICE